MDSPELEYHAEYEYGSGTCSNVIAEVAGTDPAAGSVIVCAHYDSVAGSPGASDNAGGAATVVMLAKRLASSAAGGQPPRRTVRFVLWSGHETGLHGSRQFFLDEPDALSSCRFCLNFDGIGTRLHINAIVACASPSVSGGDRVDSWRLRVRLGRHVGAKRAGHDEPRGRRDSLGHAHPRSDGRSSHADGRCGRLRGGGVRSPA